MCSMLILVVLKTLSIMANSLVSGAVILLAGALENNIWWPSLQKYVVEIACMFLRNIALASVTTTRVEEEEKALRHR